MSSSLRSAELFPCSLSLLWGEEETVVDELLEQALARQRGFSAFHI